MQTSYLLAPTEEYIERASKKRIFAFKNKQIFSFKSEIKESETLVHTFPIYSLGMAFPFRLSLGLKGKRILFTDVEIGYTHQDLEQQLSSLSLRDGIALLGKKMLRNGTLWQLAYVHAIEKAYGISLAVPTVVQNWRVALLEALRIEHHLDVTWVTTNGLVSTSQRLQLEKLKKLAHQLLMHLKGNEETIDLSQSLMPLKSHQEISNAHLGETLNLLMAEHKLYERDVKNDTILRREIKYLAIINRSKALSLGLTGPYLRACGIVDDVRLYTPYFAYEQLRPNLHLEESADMLTRLFLRLRDIAASIELIRNAIKNIRAATTLAQTDQFHELPQKPVHSFVTASLEGNEGEISVSFLFEDAKLRRVRLRTSSFALMQSLGVFLENATIEQAPMIIASLGIVGAEVDK